MTPLRNIPEDFADACRSQLGAEAGPLLDALRCGEPVRSVRLNPAKPSALAPAGEGVEWCEGGVRLPLGHPSVTLDPLFHAGGYYVQDASSMILKTIVGRIAGEVPLVVVDACAAPGGKTTAAIDAIPEGSLVIANEIIPSRCVILRENLLKWGFPATIVTRGDTASLARAGEIADIIIADVPCSGEGMMRKDADAVAQWSPRLVEECVTRQREIVDNLWTMLRPGGTLIYSTCTFNRHEDEEMVGYIATALGGEPVKIDGLPSCIAPGIDTQYPCYRFMSHRLAGEGLFVAVIKKPGHSAPRDLDARARQPRKKAAKGKQRNADSSRLAREAVEKWVSCPQPLATIDRGDEIAVFPQTWMEILGRVERATTVVSAGVTVATVKGSDLIPAHALAMSPVMARGVFPEVELPLDRALDYLRRNTLTLPPDTPRGYVAVTYGSLPLGFMKHLGNRSNNLYPAEYRIKFL